nr:GNAT family N-acetyltransferase [uncultured Dyadobacter sp.]
MQPILLNRSQIDDRLWNDLIRRSLQSVIYAHSDYLDIVCKSWKALVWPSATGFSIVMPLPIKRKAGISAVYQPLFCQYLGLFSLQKLSAAEIQSFLRALSSHFRYISSYHFNPQLYGLLQGGQAFFPQISFQVCMTHWLHLDEHYPYTRSRYSADRRTNLRRSTGWGWQMERRGDIWPLIRLFKQHHAHKIAGGVHRDAYALLEALFSRMSTLGFAELLYARRKGQIHAGILLLRYSGRIIYIFNASDQIGREGNARTWMLDQYIMAHSGQQLMIDFESPEVPSIAQFYKSFGSPAMPFIKITKNQLGFPLRQIQQYRTRD